jgi:peroxiredoxin
VTPSARRLLRTGAIGLALFAAAAWLLRAGASRLPPPAAAGQAAPRFVASTLDSSPAARSLDDYAGQPLLLNVWATWCDPCREEMPSFERLFRDYRERGLRIAAVSIDEPGSEELIRDFVRENGLTFDILHDPNSAIMRQYQVRGVPETFLISSRGEIIATRFAADWSLLRNRALVDSLLRAGAP